MAANRKFAAISIGTHPEFSHSKAIEYSRKAKRTAKAAGRLIIGIKGGALVAVKLSTTQNKRE